MARLYYLCLKEFGSFDNTDSYRGYLRPTKYDFDLQKARDWFDQTMKRMMNAEIV